MTFQWSRVSNNILRVDGPQYRIQGPSYQEIARKLKWTEAKLIKLVAEKTPKAALTELFQPVKTEDTPVVVERIVEDIDAFVRVVRFPGWQQSQAGEREVQSELRKVLWLKYKLRDQALFEKAYAYIKEYY